MVVTGPEAGRLDVWVDSGESGGEPTLSLNLRSDLPQFGVIKPIARGLDDALHRVEIVHTPGAADTAGPVGIDGFIVR